MKGKIVIIAIVGSLIFRNMLCMNNPPKIRHLSPSNLKTLKKLERSLRHEIDDTLITISFKINRKEKSFNETMRSLEERKRELDRLSLKIDRLTVAQNFKKRRKKSIENLKARIENLKIDATIRKKQAEINEIKETLGSLAMPKNSERRLGLEERLLKQIQVLEAEIEQTKIKKIKLKFESLKEKSKIIKTDDAPGPFRIDASQLHVNIDQIEKRLNILDTQPALYDLQRNVKYVVTEINELEKEVKRLETKIALKRLMQIQNEMSRLDPNSENYQKLRRRKNRIKKKYSEIISFSCTPFDKEVTQCLFCENDESEVLKIMKITEELPRPRKINIFRNTRKNGFLLHALEKKWANAITKMLPHLEEEIEFSNEFNFATDINGMTILHITAQKNKIKLFKKLAKIMSRARAGRTRRNGESTPYNCLLLDKTTCELDYESLTPMHYAVLKNNTKIIRTILKYWNKDCPYWEKLTNGNEHILEKHLEKTKTDKYLKFYDPRGKKNKRGTSPHDLAVETKIGISWGMADPIAQTKPIIFEMFKKPIKQFETLSKKIQKKILEYHENKQKKTEGLNHEKKGTHSLCKLSGNNTRA